jgi:hypothetical protein
MNQTNRTQNQKGPAGPAFSPANPFFGLLPKEFAGRLKDPFVYNIVQTIAAGVTATGTVNVQSDSDFVWTQGVVVVTDAAGTAFTNAANVPGLVQLTDSASGRALQDQATHISGWFGTAQLPFFLQMPKIFRAGGQITATTQNQSAGTLVFRYSFHGFKVFPMAAQ